MIFMIVEWFNDFMVFGPKAPGAHETLLFLRLCWKFNLWSGTYLEVFIRYLGVQGTHSLNYVISFLIK